MSKSKEEITSGMQGMRDAPHHSPRVAVTFSPKLFRTVKKAAVNNNISFSAATIRLVKLGIQYQKERQK